MSVGVQRDHRYGYASIRLDYETETVEIWGIIYPMAMFREISSIKPGTPKVLKITKDEEGKLNVTVLNSGEIVP